MKPVVAVALSSLLLLVACEKEIFGRLEVAENFDIKTRVEKATLFKKAKFANQTVPAGNWKGSLKFEDSTNVWLLIEDGVSKKISPFVLSKELKQAFKSEVNGKYLLRAQDSGQTVDAAVEIRTDVSHGPSTRRMVQCSKEIPQHRTICLRGPNGERECETIDTSITIYGEQELETHIRSVQKNILVRLQSAQTGAELASMPVQDNSAEEITDYRSPCMFGRHFGPNFQGDITVIR